jgi:hypothetical protein
VVVCVEISPLIALAGVVAVVLLHQFHRRRHHH